MVETAETNQPATQAEGSSATTWISGAGFVLFLVGVMAAVALWSEMSDTGFGGVEYATADKWLAVLSALTVSGLGLVAFAVGAVVGRLDR